MKEYPTQQQTDEYLPQPQTEDFSAQQRRMSREEQRRMSQEQNWVNRFINQRIFNSE